MNHPIAITPARSTLFALSLLVLLAGCGNEPTPPIEPAPLAPPPPAAAPAAPPPAAAPEPEPTAEELPVADDFAAEAEQGIDEKNYRVELDGLEKELSAEKAEP